MFETTIINCSPTRSVKLTFFEKLMLWTCNPGPSSTLTPLLPNRPGGGAVNAAVSNQRSTLRCPGERLPSEIRSGRPLNVFVPDGSEPEYLGVKNEPVWK